MLGAATRRVDYLGGNENGWDYRLWRSPPGRVLYLLTRGSKLGTSPAHLDTDAMYSAGT